MFKVHGPVAEAATTTAGSITAPAITMTAPIIAAASTMRIAAVAGVVTIVFSIHIPSVAVYLVKEQNLGTQIFWVLKSNPVLYPLSTSSKPFRTSIRVIIRVTN